MTQAGAPAVAGLLLQALRDLSTVGEADWNPTIDALVAALDHHGLGGPETLRAVLVSSAVIQQFLLELALRPSEGRPADLLFDTLRTLLAETAEGRGQG